MFRKFLKSKIHRGVITGTDLNYVGSITIDRELLEKSEIREYEFVQVVNINTGSRMETYTIAGDPGSGDIELNGAAARLAQPGDRVIIMAYLYLEEPIQKTWKPKILLLDDQNMIQEVLC
jgi:aspartate 1-decarboxylase